MSEYIYIFFYIKCPNTIQSYLRLFSSTDTDLSSEASNVIPTNKASAFITEKELEDLRNKGKI